MIGVETRIEIERPIGDVFDYVSDPRNFPAWNSAVQSVQPLGATTYLMERDLPGGAGANEPVGDLLGPLARGMVKRGVDENLASLKTRLERAPVSR